MAPVTWLFGPVASLNVALTLGPALSALAMFVLLRRWVTWQPAAFVGGLLYGFSPFILVHLTDAHLMLGAGVHSPVDRRLPGRAAGRGNVAAGRHRSRTRAASWPCSSSSGPKCWSS